MTYRTVRQLADAATPEELFTGQWKNLPSVLDDYKPYLDNRWSEGCINVWELWEEIVPLVSLFARTGSGTTSVVTSRIWMSEAGARLEPAGQRLGRRLTQARSA